MNRILIVLAIICINLVALRAQVERLPYLSSEKYGIVDGSGTMIISPNYDNVVVHLEHNVIALLQNDLWAIYNFDGKQILNHIIKNTKTYGSVGPVIKAVENGFSGSDYKSKPLTNLISVSDAYAKVKYYINPNSPRKTNKAYNLKEKRIKNANRQFYYPIVNNYIVTTRDDFCMSIDSTGKELFENTTETAYVLSDNFTAVGKDGLYAVYKNQNKITDFIYTNFVHLDAPGVFYGSFKKPSEDRYPKSTYHLFDKEGNIVVKSDSYIRARYKVIIVINENNESILYDFNLKKIKSFDKKPIDFTRVGTKLYIKSTGHIKKGPQEPNKRARTDYVGLYDLNGSWVMDTIYTNIVVQNNHVHCSIENIHSVLDSNFNKIIECDTVQRLESTQKEGIFKFTINGSNYLPLQGLMDINQNTIIPAEYLYANVFPCNDLVRLTNLDTSILKNMSNGKIIGQGKKNSIQVDCQNENVNISSETKRTTFDFEGNILKTYVYSTTNSKTFNTKYQAKKVGKMFALADQEGNIVVKEQFNEIEIITDPLTGQTVYFCAYAENVHPTCKVLNDELEEITPSGYSISERWVRYMLHNKGTIFVANDADIAINKYKFRSGIVDFDGKWILKPFTGLFTFINKDVFLMTNYDNKKYEFYNAKGKKVNSRDYDIIGKRNGLDYYQNRIHVGVIQDRSYIKKLENVAKDMNKEIDLDDDLSESLAKSKKHMEKIKALGEPDILYGYVNKQGKEIIPPKYINAEGFGHSEPYAIVSERDKNCNISTHIIDTLDNKILSVPYESLFKLYDGHYSCLSNGKYGIVDSTGTAKTPFKFNKLDFGLRSFKICRASDSTHNYLIDQNFNIVQLEKSDRIRLEKINDKYFFVELDFKVADTYKAMYKYFIYTYDLELLGKLDNVERIKETFNRKKLPDDYLCVIRKDNSQVVFSIKKKKLLEE